MNWPTWEAFWSMGGYGYFVWGSYAVVAASIAIEVAMLRGQRRAAVMRAGAIVRQRSQR